jgi:hypothetical protein
MRKFHAFLLAVTLMVSQGVLYAQQAPAGGSSDAVAEQLKQLRDALSQQQAQITKQQQEIERLRQQVSAQQVSAVQGTGTPHVVDAALHPAEPATVAPATVSDAPQDASNGKEKESPLSFKIGGAEFTPGGWIDFGAIYRNVNIGNGLATTFGTIPFNNTVADHVHDLRLTAQYSRISLKVTSKYGANDMTGYVEADFLGNDANNVFVSTNSHTNRLRHAWFDLRHNKWEVMAGQSWSWLAPNRQGLSPNNADVAGTWNLDPNHQVGFTYTRAAQFRFVYHPTEHWGIGIAAENPDQYVGVGEVLFPFQYNAQLGTQLDNGSLTSQAPAFHPDFIPKVAYDTDFAGGRHFHAEAGALISSARIVFCCDANNFKNAFHHSDGTGVSAEFAANVDVVKRVKILANGVIGDGNGRFSIGLGPQVVVVPNPTVIQQPSSFSPLHPADLKMVQASSGLFGIETTLPNNLQIAAYYGGAYFGQRSFFDYTNPAGAPIQQCWFGGPFLPVRCGGFGGPNSPNSANRVVQEATLDIIHQFWKSKQYGALQLGTQLSWVQRNPWFVANGAPKDAHAGMAWLSLRYILP